MMFEGVDGLSMSKYPFFFFLSNRDPPPLAPILKEPFPKLSPSSSTGKSGKPESAPARVLSRSSLSFRKRRSLCSRRLTSM
jgi:hypothetical protein